MTSQLIATEEVRDALADPFPHGATVTDLATELVVSDSTIRRHLRLLEERGQASRDTNDARSGLWRLTTRGTQASRDNESL